MWLLFGIVFVLLYCVHYYLYNAKDGQIFKKIPGPKHLPVIGLLIDYFVEPIPLFYLLRKLASEYKTIYRSQICWVRFIGIVNPMDAEIILTSTKHIKKSAVYNLLLPWLRFGLLTSYGKKWQQRRKILTPAFHFNILRQFCKIFNDQSEKTINKLKSNINDPEIDVISFITEFTMHSICETAMGIHVDLYPKKDFDKYKVAIYDIGRYLVYRLGRIWYHPTFIFKRTSVGKKQRQVLNVLHKFTMDVINHRRMTIAEAEASTIVNDIENDELHTRRKVAMLDLLLSAEALKQINEKGIREEVDTFMFEGHDTTTMAISYCLMLFANHKEIQQRAAEELEGIFEHPDQSPTVEDFNKMKYLEMCIKEALRLYPSVPYISREIAEDVQLTDYMVPAGVTCNIHIFDIHRNPSIYPAPNEFIPERFTPENCAKRHTFAYIPFSAGPRNCIGQRFAMFEEKSIISSILRNFRLEAITKPNDIIFCADLVLRPKDPIKVKLFPRYS